MSLRFLLDTNVVSEPLRPFPNPKVLERLETHQGEIGISAPGWHELLYGCERLPKSRKRAAIETYLFTIVRPTFPILAYDEAAAEWQAKERARLEAEGKTPPYLDSQIAAIAKAANLVLVTANSKDFAHFDGLTVEDWRKGE